MLLLHTTANLSRDCRRKMGAEPEEKKGRMQAEIMRRTVQHHGAQLWCSARRMGSKVTACGLL